jgi:5-methylcytosine-specific restriction endonuclease McrA
MLLPIFDQEKLCSAVGCDATASRRSLCNRHYERQRKYGSPHIVMGTVPGQIKGICSVIDCFRFVAARGLCNRHYVRKRRYGNANEPLRRVPLSPGVTHCIVTNCGNKAESRDLCSKHYARLVRLGSVEPNGFKGRSSRYRDGDTCLFDDCSGSARSLGMCNKHYQRHHRALNAMRYSNYSRHRRFRKATGVTQRYSAEQLRARMHYWGNKCWMCGGPFEHVDHVKPLAKGGRDHLANLRPSCRKCNQRKSAKWYGVSNLDRFIK